MKSRAPVIAWSLFAFFGMLSVGWIALAAVNGQDVVENVLFSMLYGSFAFVGALIASRKPDNALGWVFLWIGVGAKLGNAVLTYADYALGTGAGLVPIAPWVRSLGSLLWGGAVASILLLFVLFPHGRPETPFERWLLRTALASLVGLPLLGTALKSIDALAGPIKTVEPVVAFLAGGVAVAAVGRLLVRSRRSRGIERQQLRWFGYSALAMILILALGPVVANFVPAVRETAGNVAFVLGLSLIPIGTGVAILRYRLYELDLIVNRTLVYGLLTALLAAAYLGLVFLLQRLLEPITRESDVAIAASTLAVAALFRPLRTNVQSFIDHRFYRRKYDAAATLERFSAHLRDEVDLDALAHQLVRVVGATLQPMHASLWLRSREGHL